MRSLYEYCQQIEQYIQTMHLDRLRTHGELAVRCGFLPSLVRPNDEHEAALEPERIASLQRATRDYLGVELG